MNREEAVNTLGNFKRYISGGGVTDLKANEALDMAIEALKREPSDDLISRAEAIDALVKETEAEDAYGYTDITNIVHVISNLPSADRPRGEWTLPTEERPVDNYEIITTVYWPRYGDSIIAVGHIDRFDNWHLYSPTEGELIKGFEVIAWKTLPEPYCGADMRGDTK